MRGAIHPLPQYAFMGWCSVKAQGQLYVLPSTNVYPLVETVAYIFVRVFHIEFMCHASEIRIQPLGFFCKIISRISLSGNLFRMWLMWLLACGITKSFRPDFLDRWREMKPAEGRSGSWESWLAFSWFSKERVVYEGVSKSFRTESITK